MSYDKRWGPIAKDWILNSELPRNLMVKYTQEKYIDLFAQQLQDLAEDFVRYDIPKMEEDADEAAKNAYWDAKIDEARGK